MPASDLVSEVKTLVISSVNLHHLDPGTISEETSLRDGGLELDSVDMLEVVVAVEHHFGVKVADAEVGKKFFKTIGGIAEFVKSQRLS
ncbi:MAG: phosphopantetheine-binding protein [Bdellovibrionota bacterium]